MVESLTSLEALRARIHDWRAGGKRIALVPTMGALHNGHLRLVEEAQKQADKTIVSIFVNPTQFGPTEDFNRYPRPREQDLALLAKVGANAAWLPTVQEMYPSGAATHIHVAGITDAMEGAFRPGHFDGVATIVSKLLIATQPDIALFGEKDYQQLCIIKRMVTDLNMPVRIQGVPTVREGDGLALSSRNQYLSGEERLIAAAMHRTLTRAAEAMVRDPAGVADILADAKAALLSAGFKSVDYLELRQEDTLAPLGHYCPAARLIVAAWLGTTRLIDNIPVESLPITPPTT